MNEKIKVKTLTRLSGTHDGDTADTALEVNAMELPAYKDGRIVNDIKERTQVKKNVGFHSRFLLVKKPAKFSDTPKSRGDPFSF